MKPLPIKSSLNIITTSQEGDDRRHNSNIGRITTVIKGESNGDICIDAYKGCGETYQKRTDALITIYCAGHLQFEGTLTELINKIKNNYL